MLKHTHEKATLEEMILLYKLSFSIIFKTAFDYIKRTNKDAQNDTTELFLEHFTYK